MSEGTRVDQGLLTIDDAAAYLKVPARWVADAEREHRVRCTRIGKHVRFRIEHLDELIATGEQAVTGSTRPLRLASQGSRRAKL